jgi:hypothetical protein
MRLKSQDGQPDLDAVLHFAMDEQGEPVLYVEVSGKRIAKRYPRQPWISLDNSYRVEGGEAGDYNNIGITRLPGHY